MDFGKRKNWSAKNFYNTFKQQKQELKLEICKMSLLSNDLHVTKKLNQIKYKF